MSQGYFFVALGVKYITECLLLSTTIRKMGDRRPISLLVNPEDVEYARSLGMFDQLIEFKPDDQIWRDSETGFEKFCLYPRIMFHTYLPYEHNIIVDSDVICIGNTEGMWKYMTERQSPIAMLGRENDPNWHWGSINEVIEKYGKHVPHTHGGFFYLRKDPLLDKFFQYCHKVFYRYDDFGCKRAFRGGKVDEIIFAIAHSFFNMNPINFDEGFMAFNYTPDYPVPSHIQNEGGKIVYAPNPIVFVHMFDKMEGANYQLLLRRILT